MLTYCLSQSYSCLKLRTKAKTLFHTKIKHEE
jgi:hypothetical protein